MKNFQTGNWPSVYEVLQVLTSYAKRAMNQSHHNRIKFNCWAQISKGGEFSFVTVEALLNSANAICLQPNVNSKLRHHLISHSPNFWNINKILWYPHTVKLNSTLISILNIMFLRVSWACPLPDYRIGMNSTMAPKKNILIQWHAFCG